MQKHDDNLPKRIPTDSNLPVSTSKLTNFDLDEVLAKIDAIKHQGFGPEPSIIESILSSAARDRKQAIEEARISAINVRKDLINSLSGAIAVYVDTHKADLQVRGSTFVQATFTKLTGALYQVSEDVVSGFYRTWAKSADDYESIPRFTDEMRKQKIQEALRNAEKQAELQRASYNTILKNIEEQVIKLSKEIGQR